MVFRMEVTYSEIEKILDVKYNPTTFIGYTLPRGIYASSDINLTLKFSFSDDVKVTVTVDDIRLKSKLTTNKTLRFTKRSFF